MSAAAVAITRARAAFHSWLVLGLAMDAALTWAAFAGWSPTPTDLAS